MNSPETRTKTETQYNKKEDTLTSNPISREKFPIWKFSENKIEFTFENLVLLIRLFLCMCVFYLGVWIFRDKNADIRSTAQLFSLYNSFFCSVLSIYYFLTGSVFSVFLIIASLFSYTIADIYYGYFHYHHIMCGLNGYAHHFVYLCFCQYLIYIGYSNINAAFAISEIPTFLLNIKYVFQMESFPLQLLILFGFIIFRVIIWGAFIVLNMDTAKKYITTGIFSIGTLILHIHWTSIHAYKTWKKYIAPGK